MTYRNKRLLEACRELPCSHCGTSDGTVCAAHSNWSTEGKGMAMKASDAAVAALCFVCHAILDSGKGMNREERRLFWLEAYVRTMIALIERGILKI